MIILVLGPNGSGKSMYAEKIAAGFSTPSLYYIATMIPFGDEGKARVDKHKKQRMVYDFVTVERPFGVSEIPIPSDSVVLLEDVSNMLGNVLFSGEQDGNEDSVFDDIRALCAKCRACVFVSIDGLTVQLEYNEETRGYIDALSRLNRRLSDFADVVIQMQNGNPVFVKGEFHAMD